MSAAFYANRVLDELGVRDPKDLRLLDLVAKARGALVRSEVLTGAEARLVSNGCKAIITVSSTVTDLHRRRFDTAHELGHWEMHRYLNNLFVCMSSDIDNEALRSQARPDRQREWAANEFAAALLLPDRFFIPLCQDKDPSLELIVDLANTFEVSRTATALRYIGCCAEPCAVVFSQDGYIKWHRGSRAFDQLGLFVDWDSELSSDTLADRFFQGHSLPPTQKPVNACAWFAPGRYRSDAQIQEQSFAIPSCNAVLSLLFIDEDLEEADEDEWGLGTRRN